ncbi:hypothetical protein VTI74DRAFT_4645 [Chaetomium olivicolor]
MSGSTPRDCEMWFCVKKKEDSIGTCVQQQINRHRQVCDRVRGSLPHRCRTQNHQTNPRPLVTRFLMRPPAPETGRDQKSLARMPPQAPSPTERDLGVTKRANTRPSSRQKRASRDCAPEKWMGCPFAPGDESQGCSSIARTRESKIICIPHLATRFNPGSANHRGCFISLPSGA